MEVPVKRQYDVIFMTQVLEHITHPREMVERLYASLVPGGIPHLDVPNQGTLAGWPSRLLRGSGPGSAQSTTLTTRSPILRAPLRCFSARCST